MNEPSRMSTLDLYERIMQDREAKRAADDAQWLQAGSAAEAQARPSYVSEPRWRAMLRRLRAQLPEIAD